MTMYRITRTTLRGPFENDRCFLDWMAAIDSSIARIDSWADDPMNDGGNNDRRYYIWGQDGDVKGTPAGCDPDLISDPATKKNGWPTRGEAGAVLGKLIGSAAAAKAKIVEANEAAVAPAKIAKGAVEDVAKAGAAVAEDVGKAVAKGAAGGAGPYVALAVLAGGALLLWRAFRG